MSHPDAPPIDPFDDAFLATIASEIDVKSSADRLRELLKQAHRQLEANRDRNLKLAEVVADSAAIFEELERTKEQLAVAQREAEVAHQSTLEFAESIFERTQDAMFVLRNDGRCLTANQNAIDLLRLDRERLAQRNVADQLKTSFESVDDTQWFDSATAQLGKLDIVTRECRCSQSGSSKWIEFSFKATSPDCSQFLLVGRDISAQKEAEIQLRRNRDFLDNIINALPDALCVKSNQLKPVLINDQYRSLLGSLKLDAYEAQERQLLEAGGCNDHEEQILDDDGQRHYLSIRRSVFLDPVTHEQFLVAAYRDVTQQRSIEEHHRSLASVFLNAREGVVLLDLDGNITEANPEFIKFTGLDRSRLDGTKLDQFVEWQELNFAEMIEAAKTGEPSLGRVTLNASTCDLDASNRKIYWGSISRSGNETDQATSLIAMFSDITQIEETQKRLHRQALHDNLTGLPNRRYFTERLQELIAIPRAADERFAVCFLDLDDFKVVNDTLGHDAGDQLLIDVAERIKSVIYRDCFFSRFGGDEFALLIPETIGTHRIVRIAEEIVDALQAPFGFDENQIHIGVSIGVTLCPDDGNDVNELLRHADVAMYHAKDVGKNTVHEFTPQLVASIEERQRLLNDLRKAVEARDVTLVYQPKLNLKSNRLSGCEALVRWVKDGSVVNPAKFIDVAEKSGLIYTLGDQVLELAMRQTKEWRDNNVFDGTVAINLSPRQLVDPDFIDRFEELISDTESKPEWFEFEITENAVIENLDQCLSRMSHIRKLGSRIAIDDFGTGYSSLTYLKAFPVSTLKIDLSFVRDLPEDTKAVAVARTVLSLGHGLGLEVVAEGVENRAQYEFLKAAGCDVIQGYYVNRPLQPLDFAEYALDFSGFDHSANDST